MARAVAVSGTPLVSEGAGWHVIYATQSTAGHITPINDMIDHSKRFCICKPKWKFDSQPIGIVCTVIHNSLDGREGTWVETDE